MTPNDIIIVPLTLERSNGQSELYRELEIDNPDARTIDVKIVKSHIQMWAVSECGERTDVWFNGAIDSNELEIHIDDFEDLMFEQ